MVDIWLKKVNKSASRESRRSEVGWNLRADEKGGG
jgi:hypothetical protein